MLLGLGRTVTCLLVASADGQGLGEVGRWTRSPARPWEGQLLRRALPWWPETGRRRRKWASWQEKPHSPEPSGAGQLEVWLGRSLEREAGLLPGATCVPLPLPGHGCQSSASSLGSP